MDVEFGVLRPANVTIMLLCTLEALYEAPSRGVGNYALQNIGI